MSSFSIYNGWPTQMKMWANEEAEKTWETLIYS